MINLIKYTQELLLKNDCVIIPQFGGFVTHYSTAKYIKEKQTFLSPSIHFGFNQQLQINDGLLAQHYMKKQKVSFAEANRRIEQGVEQLVNELNTKGEIEIPQIGLLTCSLNQQYEFIEKNELISPSTYGLNSFNLKEVKTLKEEIAKQQRKELQLKRINKAKKQGAHISIAFAQGAAAAIIGFITLFYFSTPIENTYVEKDNFAQIIPSQIFSSLQDQSMASNTIETSGNEMAIFEAPASSLEQLAEAKLSPISIENNYKKDITETSIAEPSVEEIAPEAPVVNSFKKEVYPYHLIVASLNSMSDAHKAIDTLKKKGYSEARIIACNNKIRVCLNSFSKRADAFNQLSEIRKINTYKSAWILVGKIYN